MKPKEPVLPPLTCSPTSTSLLAAHTTLSKECTLPYTVCCDPTHVHAAPIAGLTLYCPL